MMQRQRIGLIISVGIMVQSCILPSADFSAYHGTNLIPDKQLTVPSTSPDLGWTPDETPLTTYSSAINMWYESVSSATGINDSSDNFAGYTDDLTLRTGLPLLADGTAAPIFRLETKNLFMNGDFEAGDFVTTPNDSSNAHRTRVSASSIGAAYTMRGNWNQLNFDDASQSVAIPLPGNIFDYTVTNSYAFSFKYIIDFEPNKYIALDDGSSVAGGNASDAITFAIQNSPVNQEHRFPFEVFAVADPINESSILSTTNSLQYIIFNPQPKAPNHLINGSVTVGGLKGSLDDFQIVRTAYPNGLRINIPWSQAGRPDLQRGGIYTVKLWVRMDKTSNYSTAGSSVPNRFASEFLSISLHPNVASTGATGTIGAVVTNSAAMGTRATAEGWTDYTDWNTWTEVSASFSGELVLSTQNTSGNALQLVLSATNMGNSALRSAGSLLIANPQLYWSEN